MRCARFNYTKRQQTTDMWGRIALVTGARVKIGFRIALKLLRCGATVLITTRFPSDAADRFLAETDSSRWSSRLHVLALDFRDARTVEVFAAYLTRRLTHLDILINNAAQTVRRPPAYYHHLIDAELSLQSTGIGEGSGVSAAKRGMLTEYFALLRWGNVATDESVEAADALMGDSLGDKIDGMPRRAGKPSAVLRIAASVTVATPPDLVAARHSALAIKEDETRTVAAGDAAAGGAAHPTAMAVRPVTDAAERKPLPSRDGAMSVLTAPVLSQVALLSEDAAAKNAALFPQGALDGTGQQLDLRAEHTWSMRLSDVPAVEAAEMMAINAIAPMVLTARLRPLMSAEPPAGHPSRALGVERAEGRISLALSAQAAFSFAFTMRGDPSEALNLTAIERELWASATGPSRLSRAADSVAKWNASAISQAIASADIGNQAASKARTVAIPPQAPPQHQAAASAAAGAAVSAGDDGEGAVGADEEGFGVNTPADVLAMREELRAMAHRPDRFVVQVTAREGMFSPSFKKPFHPHTNAAKAALHMVVRTSAADFAMSRIFMTAVDTGWCSPMQPAHRAAAIEKRDGFLTPVDDVDGAARVLDPIISSIASSLDAEAHKGLDKAPVWGVLLKHYAPHAW
jgi:NAD(P)-dependent dehydrogenase (short-subunit alcohol dehydrogenase family)